MGGAIDCASISPMVRDGFAGVFLVEHLPTVSMGKTWGRPMAPGALGDVGGDDEDGAVRVC